MRTWSQARSKPRQQQVIAAALGCYSETGIDEALIEDIARRAHASVGSIYHQFESKSGLAAAVYLEGLRRYQEGFLAALSQTREARNGIERMIAFHLSWVEDHPDWARFLLKTRHADFLKKREADIGELNRAFGRTVAAWLAPHIESGKLRPLPIDVFMALLLGPSQEYIRAVINGRAPTPLAKAILLLSEGAWRALGSAGHNHSVLESLDELQ